MIVKLDYYEKNRENFEIFHKDLQNDLDWMFKNEQSAGKIGANYLPAKSPVISAAIEHSSLCVLKAHEAKDALMNFYEILFDLNPKILGNKLPQASFFL